jgi:hypothetical protein
MSRPERRFQRPAGAGKGLVYTGGCRIRLLGQLPHKTLDAHWGAADYEMFRRCQHLIGDPIRFLLIHIARFTHCQLRL